MIDSIKPPILAKAALVTARGIDKVADIPTHMTNSSLTLGSRTHAFVGAVNQIASENYAMLEPRGPAKLISKLFDKIDSTVISSAEKGQKATTVFWVPFSQAVTDTGAAMANPFALMYANKAGYTLPDDAAEAQKLLASVVHPDPYVRWPTNEPAPEPKPEPKTPDGGSESPKKPDGGDTPTDPKKTPDGDTPTDPKKTPDGDTPTDPKKTPDGDTPTDPKKTPDGDTPTDPKKAPGGDTPPDPSGDKPKVADGGPQGVAPADGPAPTDASTHAPSTGDTEVTPPHADAQAAPSAASAPADSTPAGATTGAAAGADAVVTPAAT